jgi:hypothetical protein
MMRTISLLLLATAALTLAACGGKTLDTSEVETDVQKFASAEGVETKVECPDEVEDVEEGKTYDCTITYAGNEDNKQTVQMKIAANDESEFVNQKAVEDEGLLRQLVAQVDENPVLICENVTEEILEEELGGEECPQRAQEADEEPTKIKSIKVEGDTATMVTDESTSIFERAEEGGWVLTGQQ